MITQSIHINSCEFQFILFCFCFFDIKLFLYTEFENTFTVVSLSRFQNYRRPVCLVRTVRIVLCLQTNRSTLVINEPFFAGYRSIEEVTGINLYTRFVGIYFQSDEVSLAATWERSPLVFNTQLWSYPFPFFN